MTELIQEHGYIDAWPIGSVLIKADPKKKDVLFIEASNEIQDAQGDTLLQKALENEKESYLQKGVVSYDHLHKIEKDPNYVIGEPIDVKFIPGKTLVKAKMYMANKYAQGVMAMAKSGSTRIGASVGGWIKKRVQRVDEMTKSIKQYITDVVWDETALTIKPINEATLGGVSIMPFTEFAKSFVAHDTELYKALTAGAGSDSTAMTGGRTLVPESLMGATVKMKQADIDKGIATICIDLKKGLIKTYKDMDSLLVKTGLVPYRTKIMQMIVSKKN